MIERGLSSMKKYFGRSAVCSSVLVGTLWLGMGPTAASEIRVFSSGAPSAVQKVMAAKFTDTRGQVTLVGPLPQELQSYITLQAQCMAAAPRLTLPRLTCYR